MVSLGIVLPSRVILEELLLSIAIPGKYFTVHSLGAIFHRRLPGGNYWMFCLLGITLVQDGNIERVNFQYTTFHNYILQDIGII